MFWTSSIIFYLAIAYFFGWSVALFAFLIITSLNVGLAAWALRSLRRRGLLPERRKSVRF